MSRTKYRDKLFIYRRKLKAFFEGIVFYICWVFPVQPYKVVMWTMEGKGGYGDSPKYITEEMIRRNTVQNKKFEIIWLSNYGPSGLGDKEFPDYVKVVKDSLWNRAYHLSTAGFWVGNTRTIYGTKKRHKTVYIQTWHAIAGTKPIGKFRGDKLPEIAKIISEYDSNLIDYVLSGNEWSCKMWPDGLIYYGEILKSGVPRCDVLFEGKGQIRRKYREKYNIPLDSGIILYAPTFRGGSQNGKRSVIADVGHLDFERLIKAVGDKFGGSWYVFFRRHPQVAGFSNEAATEKKGNRVIDVSWYPDMNELIAASDILITDYSSSVFESIIINQAVFLYMEDKEEYIRDRGDLLFDINELPFPAAYDMDGLEKQIDMFDVEAYERNVDEFKKKMGMFEDGRASVRVVDFIEEKLNSNITKDNLRQGVSR